MNHLRFLNTFLVNKNYFSCNKIALKSKLLLKSLAHVHFLSYFEGTDLATLAHLVATFARCSPCYRHSHFYKEIGFALLYYFYPHYCERAPVVG